ncbi:MAG: response regulator transcription factor [Bdellovibrionaceae bacterium]|nr:response regulator transcription factor [Pseudobdellovibrionaceae bacterium]NUM60185.1 response regulator transcription factor [Pseudobdellovibrionaceae bacterium]
MGAQKKILIVDDYEESCTLLKDILNDSYDCLTTQDSTQTFDLLSSYKPNLVILDYKMPGLLGVDICAQIRETENLKYIPVVFVSGAATIDEKIKAFEMGADDFVSKPFHVKELILRIKRLMDRDNEPQSELVASNLKMNLLSRRVYVDNNEVQLTPKQFDILKLLVGAKNNLVSREKFLEEIWGDTEVTSRNVDSQINYLKRKIEAFKGKISAVPSLGYRLDVQEG